jgi:hypothetical protein
MSGDDPKKIVEFPKAEIVPEERARRLKMEVERLASLPVVERLFYVECEDVAEKHGVSRDVMKAMVKAQIKANEKRAREDRAENHRSEQRVEKAQTKARREEERARREQARAEKEAERRRKERAKEFEAIAKLPLLAHEARLADLAKRWDEDVDFLRDKQSEHSNTEV